MTDLLRVALLSVAAAAGLDLLTQLRLALEARLRADATLIAALRGEPGRIQPRQRLVPGERPLVTYLDFGHYPDAQVPFMDRTIQIDTWGTDARDTARIAGLVARNLDCRPGKNRPMLAVPGVFRGVYQQLIRDSVDVAEEGDRARVTHEYRLLGYDLTQGG
jgi:hypothetical protein